jgi:L-phenylalanine/L-methionine N-acetyltransferase
VRRSKRLENNDPNSSYVLVAVVDGKAVGIGSLFWASRPRKRHVADLGIMVHDDYQGRGIGKRLMAALVDTSDRWLGLLRIELEVYADNERAIKLYERFGFVMEGRKRMDAFRDGQYVDSLVMGRIRPGAE